MAICMDDNFELSSTNERCWYLWLSSGGVPLAVVGAWCIISGMEEPPKFSLGDISHEDVTEDPEESL